MASLFEYGSYGGTFIPETLIPAVKELESAYAKAKKESRFQKEYKDALIRIANRPSPLYYAENLTRKTGGAKIYLKREDLNHTGAHKINNTIGQILLAKRMGKKRIIAETGAGQHGVATATTAALFGLDCVIYMGEVDMKRQALNVFRMRLLGAEVVSVKSGSRTLKDAVNEALRDWTANVENTYYLLGSVLGPHPYPMMVRDFQKVIGQETRRQILKLEGRLPNYLVACVGGGSNAIGLFYPFIKDKKVALIGVEAGGYGISSGKHAARFSDKKKGRPGILHGTHTYVLQDKDGQVQETHSISAGLDYAAAGPEHAQLKDSGRAKYVSADDREALKAVQILSEQEGILPALESAHAVAYGIKLAKKQSKNKIIIVNLSGRGDKDMEEIHRQLKM